MSALRIKGLATTALRNVLSTGNKRLTVFLQDLPLSRINITKTNVDQSFRFEARLDPVEFGNVGAFETEQEGYGTSVKVTTGSCERCVDVLRDLRKEKEMNSKLSEMGRRQWVLLRKTHGVSVDPDESGFGVGFEGSCNGSHGLYKNEYERNVPLISRSENAPTSDLLRA